jgi:hypothetical protein
MELAVRSMETAERAMETDGDGDGDQWNSSRNFTDCFRVFHREASYR